MAEPDRTTEALIGRIPKRHCFHEGFSVAMTVRLGPCCPQDWQAACCRFSQIDSAPQRRQCFPCEG